MMEKNHFLESCNGYDLLIQADGRNYDTSDDDNDNNYQNGVKCINRTKSKKIVIMVYQKFLKKRHKIEVVTKVA